MEITAGLYAFIWRNPRANNANTFLIAGKKNILIDPGHLHLFDHIVNGLGRLGITVSQVDVVLVTHAHIDHMEAVGVFGESTLIAMSREAFQLIEGGGGKIREPEFFLQEGTLTVGDVSLDVLMTPGHCPGSLSFYWPDRKALFTGDVVFSQGIGRTDLPGGSGRLLKESIERLSRLDVDYLLPGHGAVVVGKEKVKDNFRMVADYWFDYLD